MNSANMTDEKVKAERLLELIELFDGASKMCTNIIDPPFDCVPLNIRPSTCVEIASILASQAALQAERDKLSGDLKASNEERCKMADQSLEQARLRQAAEAKLTALVEALETAAEWLNATPEGYHGALGELNRRKINDVLASLSAPPATPTSAPVEDVGGLVAELSNLLERATPGPWQLQDGCSWRRIGTSEHDGNVLCPTKNPRDGHPDLMAGRGEDTYANLNLICAAVNALPALLALQAERDKLSAEVERLTELHAARFREQQRYVSLYHAERIAKEAAEAKLTAPVEAAKKLDQWSLVIKYALRESNDLGAVTAAIDGVRQALAHHSAPVGEPMLTGWPKTTKPKQDVREFVASLDAPPATPTSAPVEDVGAYNTIVAVLDTFHDGQREKKARAILAALSPSLIQPTDGERIIRSAKLALADLIQLQGEERS